MDIILHVVHVITALALIGLILVQQGKGADAGASFGGGASQAMLGGAGGGNFLSRATAILAVVFMLTSLALAWYARQQAEAGDRVLPAMEEAGDADVPGWGEIEEDEGVVPRVDEDEAQEEGLVPRADGEDAEGGAEVPDLDIESPPPEEPES